MQYTFYTHTSYLHLSYNLHIIQCTKYRSYNVFVYCVAVIRYLEQNIPKTISITPGIIKT